ncbi:MAG TPA: glutathione S-transferase family protein [Xanthobacteraceae bacterium]|nr:glutathione S-transferase family protein [Xanthobacteraceae bacterium]
MKQTRAPSLTLVSHHLCPYVQRAAIVVAEKGIACERRYIDLAAKLDWFRAISPLGKVPLLLVRGRDGEEEAIFESAVICEYLEDMWPQPRLHPQDPLERAKHRGWIEFGSSILADIWNLETATDASTHEKVRQALIEKFVRLESAVTGPYFAGETFSMVDAVFGPIFRYFDVFDTIVDMGVFAQTEKVRAWRTVLMQRPSVTNAAPRDYADRLRAFLDERRAHLLTIAH